MKQILSYLLVIAAVIVCGTQRVWADDPDASPTIDPSNRIFYWNNADGDSGYETEVGSIEQYYGSKNYLNYKNSSFRTICLAGSKSNITSSVENDDKSSYMLVTLERALEAGDIIEMTAYRNNVDGEKASSACLWLSETSYITIGGEYGLGFANIYGVASPTLTTLRYTIATGCPLIGATSFRMTREKTGTNLYITSLAIGSSKKKATLAFTPSALTVTQGESVDAPRLTARYNGGDVTSEFTKLTYSSSNPEVVTFDDSGALIVVGPGTASITATHAWHNGCDYDNVSASYIITVNPTEQSLVTTRTWNFSDSQWTGFDTEGVEDACITVGDISFYHYDKYNMKVASQSATINGTGYSRALKTLGKGQFYDSGTPKARVVQIDNVGTGSNIKIAYQHGGNKAIGREFAIAAADGSFRRVIGVMTGESDEVSFNYTGTSGSIYIYGIDNAITIFSIEVTGEVKTDVTMSFAESIVEKETAKTIANALTVSPSVSGIIYTSSNTSVATVNGSGEVTTVACGTATITAYYPGDGTHNSAYASYTVLVRNATPDVTLGFSGIANPAYLSLGRTQTFTVTATPAVDTETIQLSTSNPNVARINSSGKLEVTGCGEATITAIFPGNDSYNPAAATFKVVSGENIMTNSAGGYGYATFAPSHTTVTVPAAEVATVYYVSAFTTQTATLTPIAPGTPLVKGEGVIIRTAGGASTVPLYVTDSEASDIDGNKLIGSTDSQSLADGLLDGNPVYVLSGKGGQIGFYRYTGKTLAAGKAYLLTPDVVVATAPAFLGFFFDDDDMPTAIDEPQAVQPLLSPVYDLSGRRVQRPIAGGIYIQNGRKIAIYK